MMDTDHVPTWLQAKVDQRMAQLKEQAGDAFDNVDFTVVMLSLTDPPEASGPAAVQAWETSCDCCHLPFPGEGGLLVGTMPQQFNTEVVVEITFGTCRDCFMQP